MVFPGSFLQNIFVLAAPVVYLQQQKKKNSNKKNFFIPTCFVFTLKKVLDSNSKHTQIKDEL